MTNETIAAIEALEPCPFCGGQDAFVERADFSSCYVVCNSCGARGPTSCNENEDDCAAEDRGMEPGENAARRRWNTRASARDTARLEAEVARLREVCREAELTFRHYEKLHLAKGTPDGDEKAYRNKQMADKLALAALSEKAA